MTQKHHIVNGVRRSLPEYDQWASMRKRCNSGRNKSYLHCSYIGDWEDYSEWLTWATEQTGFLKRDFKGRIFQLDKDLLFAGNKLYSPDNCLFLPFEVNGAIRSSASFRGELPYGVCRRYPVGKFTHLDKPYMAQASLGGESPEYLGVFSDVGQAHLRAIEAREGYIRQLAEKYAGQLDERATRALMQYSVKERLDFNPHTQSLASYNREIANLSRRACS